MIRTLVVRGVLTGLVAGLAAGGFGFALGEPRIDRAIEIERQRAEPAGVAASRPVAEPVSRDGQRAGLLLATSLYGTAVGGLFALAFALARGRVGPRRDPALAVALAAALFLGGVLVPFAKYPANPPAVGDPATIGDRTELYLVMVAVGLLAVLAASRVARRASAARRIAAAVTTFAATVGAAYALLPGVNEVPRTFPADLLWDFRVVSLGTQAVLWTALAVAFALSAERAARREAA